MSVIGQTIFRTSEETDEYFSPWFPAQGNLVSVLCDVIHYAGTMNMDLQIWTKKSEDSDDAADIVNATNSGTGAVAITLGQNVQTEARGGDRLDNSLGYPGLKDMVRFKFILKDGAPGDLVHFRMLVGSWLSN